MVSEKSVMAVIRASRPSFRNDNDKVAFVVHASFLASGYLLTAAGPPAFSDSALASSSTEEVGIDHWNDAEDEYGFVYINPEKGSKNALVKCLAVNSKLLVDALADGGLEPVHLEIDVKNHVGENGGTNYSLQFKDLDKLVKLVDTELLSKLHNSPKSTSSVNKPTSSEGLRHDKNEPDFEAFGYPDPHIHPAGIVYPPVMPFGGSDIFPGPGAGMYPTRGGYGFGGSMLLGPNDPRWFGGRGDDPTFPGGQPGVPPGARFDPYGPPGIPGFEPNRFTRNPRRPGGGTHPDLEHFGGGSDYI